MHGATIKMIDHVFSYPS